MSTERPIQSAADPIPDDFLPEGVDSVAPTCEEHDASDQPEPGCEVCEDRAWKRFEHSVWRAALRAERERVAFAWKRMSCGHPGACMVGGEIIIPGEPSDWDAECDWCACERAERAAADARVRAVVFETDRIIPESRATTHWATCDHVRCAWLRWLREHEPALAKELGAEKDGDNA